MRKASVVRTTGETVINVEINLDGCGNGDIKTGIGFFDHMLHAFVKHSGFDLKVSAKGDLHVDCHHSVEDIGICMGKAFNKAMSDKNGIARYGSFHAPMDEALAHCVLDISGRPFLIFNGDFKSHLIGNYDTQATVEFFRAFAFNAMITLHIDIPYGENDHHKTEAAFKAFGHALSAAAAITGADGVLSTKGVL